MSISIIQEQINKFLSDGEPAVIAIKGQWGVGKTYSWNNFIKDAQSKGSIKFERYSYVSLFGVNSLDTLKYSIFENTIPKASIGKEPSIETFQNNTKAISEGVGRKTLGFVKYIPYVKNIAPVLESLTFLSLREIIICIDDLERKGNGLSLKDVLGLVSLLKEQKKCKVVLLLNDGTEETKDYETYKEKVIDIEFSFKPTALECSQIAYGNLKDYHEYLRDLTSSVGITNIRVLKKIERLVESVVPFSTGVDSSILNSMMHSIVLYFWCHYCFNDDELVPSLDFIENEQFMFYGSFNKEKDNDPKKLAWKAIIAKYKYHHTSELDKILLNAVKHGYFNDSDIIGSIQSENEKILEGRSRDNFISAWDLYHGTFDNNEVEVINSLYQSFLSNYKSITPNNLDNLVCFLREFGENEKASSIIDVYIAGRKDEVELFDIYNRMLFTSLEDGELIDRFNSVYHECKLKDIGSLSDVLLRISNENSWNDEDVDFLTGLYIEDYYNVFKTVRGRDMYKVVKASLLFGGIGGNKKYQIIDEKTKWALTIISYESEINRRRVRNFVSNLE